MILLVTGGAGFIGSNLVLMALSLGHGVVNIDKLTYAGNLDSLNAVRDNPRYRFVHGDIADPELLRHVFSTYAPDGLLNLAAESHVDRSIDGPRDFINTNIGGTFCLLEAARSYYETLTDDRRHGFRFLHVSTDEVFGSLGDTDFFSEATRYSPNSPYSASKAAADHLVRAWHHTYGLPVLTTNCSNNYGPYQFPEKLIPHMITSALNGRSLPIYGDGSNVRDWLYVEDHCRALLTVLEKGTPGETYVIGGNNEKTNLEIVSGICGLLDQLSPRKDGKSYQEQLAFVKDRPGHDKRYAVDFSKIKKCLGWMPKETFENGLLLTVQWYLASTDWTKRILDGSYRLERLGVATKDWGNHGDS